MLTQFEQSTLWSATWQKGDTMDYMNRIQELLDKADADTLEIIYEILIRL